MLKYIKNKNTSETFTQERCFVDELVNDASLPQISLARCRVEPGITTQLHALKNMREVYLIESGSGIMDDGTSPGVEVKAGDSVVIPPDHPQRIFNNGQADLVFLATCMPRFEPKHYTDLEIPDKN